MTLLEYTSTNGRWTRKSSIGAILLSMLPYGLLLKTDAVGWYRGRNGSTKVGELVEQGYVNEYCMTIKTKKDPYELKFLGLTPLGLQYLADNYGTDYPWLRAVVEAVGNRTDLTFRNTHGDSTAKMLLKVQSCNVFFNRAGIRTIIDRLRDNPYQALCAMKVLANQTVMKNSLLPVVADALETWLKCEGPKFEYSGVGQIEFFDSVEMRVPECGPYRGVKPICEPEDFIEADDRAHYRASYLGVVKSGEHVFFVYRSSRDGAAWNGGSMLSSWNVIAEQLYHIGLRKYDSLTPNSFPSIMLVDGKGSGVAAFARIFKDNRKLRKPVDHELGRGAISLHVVPMTKDGISMMRAFIPISAGSLTYAAQFKQEICKSWPTLFKMEPLDVLMDLRYKDIPCSFCMDMDAKSINQCLNRDIDRKAEIESGSPPEVLKRFDFAVVCFEWQTPYVRALFPDVALIVGIDDSVQPPTLKEHRPKKK